jgi:glycosyltransferase involved in cell wall biosynthesis
MAGKAIVSTFFGGPSETIVEGESGLCVKPL